MVTTMARVRQETPPWLRTAASLLPLWLFALAVTAEGFPRPPISIVTAQALFYLGLTVSIVLIALRWLTVELILFSVLPFVYLFAFDEISTAYKTPLILACTLVLSAGVVLYQLSRRRVLGVLVLLLAAALVLVMVGQASDNYWELHSQVLGRLGVDNCFLDASGCPQFSGQETPWWQLFFHP